MCRKLKKVEKRWTRSVTIQKHISPSQVTFEEFINFIFIYYVNTI